MGRLPAYPSDKSRCNCYTDSRGHEVMKNETCHLGKVGQGGLSPVALPVRIGCETDCRVEGKMFTHGSIRLRIQRKKMLKPENCICEQEADQAEDEKRQGILLPGLLFFRVEPEDLVKQIFHRSEGRIQDRFPFGVQDLCQIHSDRLCQQKQNSYKYD